MTPEAALMGLYTPSEAMAWVTFLYAAGFALVFLEIFIPGWIAGTAGVLSLFLAVYLAWRDLSAVAAVFLAAGGAVGIPLILRWGMNRVALKRSLSASEGYLPPGREGLEMFVGKKGVAATVLRPSGAVEVEGKRFDARSERGVVEKGNSVEVVRVEASELVVKRVERGN